MENQRAFFEDFRRRLGFEDFESLYALSNKRIAGGGGASLLRNYNDSLYLVLKSLYPNYDWVPWKFKKAPHDLLKTDAVVQRALAEVETHFHITSPNDWLRMSLSQLRQFGGFEKVFPRLHTLRTALVRRYPDVDWSKFEAARSQ